MSIESKSLFEMVGGKPMLEKVHKKFYDKLYENAWMKHFFTPIPREHIENQQTDFMTKNMGGGNVYSGGLPQRVHMHMFITDEMYDLRQKYLRESILECGVAQELCDRWIKIDNAFRHLIVKKSLSDCQKRFTTDEILNFPKPENL